MTEGLVLMAVGMSVVFAFLGVLIGAMNLCAAFFARFAHWFPDPVRVTVAPAAKTDPLPEIAAAIAAARTRLR